MSQFLSVLLLVTSLMRWPNISAQLQAQSWTPTRITEAAPLRSAPVAEACPGERQLRGRPLGFERFRGVLDHARFARTPKCGSRRDDLRRKVDAMGCEARL